MFKEISKRHARLLLRIDAKLDLFEEVDLYVPLDKNESVRLVIEKKKVFKIKGGTRQEIVEYLNK